MDVKEFMREKGLDKEYYISKEIEAKHSDYSKVYLLSRIDQRYEVGGVSHFALKKDGEIREFDYITLFMEGII